MRKIHKTSGWTREHIVGDKWRITPTDGSGIRIVGMMSAHTWQNYPGDDPARRDQDRVFVIEGPALPGWAVEWLEKANRQSCERARDAFRAAIDDADGYAFR